MLFSSIMLSDSYRSFIFLIDCCTSVLPAGVTQIPFLSRIKGNASALNPEEKRSFLSTLQERLFLYGTTVQVVHEIGVAHFVLFVPGSSCSSP